MAELFSALSEGKSLQIKRGSSGEWEDTRDYPVVYGDISNWRVKPELKPVDLSVLIESGIDCEFWDKIGAISTSIKTLTGIDSSLQYPYLNTAHSYKYCQPRHDYWHVWLGGDCPLPRGFVIDCMLRNGNTYENAVDLSWEHAGYGSDIIAFKVLRLADGYCYPWECK